MCIVGDGDDNDDDDDDDGDSEFSLFSCCFVFCSR